MWAMPYGSSTIAFGTLAIVLKYMPGLRYMSGFKGRVKTDISRWRATKESRATLVCLYRTSGQFLLLITHGGIFSGVPPRYVYPALSLISRHR